MSELRQHFTEHALTVGAEPRAVYDVIADVDLWPAVFEPTIYVRRLTASERWERFQLWALLNDEVTSWTSRRNLHPERLSITFEQEVSQPPIAYMGGEWRLRALPGDRTEIVLRHRYSAVGDDPSSLAWIEAALEDTSTRELAAVGRVVEAGHRPEELVFWFKDTIESPVSASCAFDFMRQADRWADVLPHVRRVRLDEPSPGVQQIEMDTVISDGSSHSTRSFRIHDEREWIAYKQMVLPPLLRGHSGLWTFKALPSGGSWATARHAVALDPDAVTEVLGPGKTLADARAYVRENLGSNSRTTLEYAAAVSGNVEQVPVAGA
jgi:aromatase